VGGCISSAVTLCVIEGRMGDSAAGCSGWTTLGPYSITCGALCSSCSLYGGGGLRCGSFMPTSVMGEPEGVVETEGMSGVGGLAEVCESVDVESEVQA
jgi:hypothetical protein